jgi:hypothetical protein
VVDCDCVGVADALERRFPVLLDAPMETTRKGRHYFFRRSALADARGYYDGARQRMASVDFKTRCETGTGGVIAVAPSTNKCWVRALWSSDGLAAIPDDLLDAVARPRHVPATLSLHFVDTGEDLQVVDCPYIGRMAYFAMFVGDDGTGDETVNVPNCTSRQLLQLLELCKTGEVRWLEPFDGAGAVPSQHAALMRALKQSADYIGLPMRYMDYFADGYGTAARREALNTVSPQWATAAILDAAVRFKTPLTFNNGLAEVLHASM